MLAPLDTLAHLTSQLRARIPEALSAGDQGFVSLVLELPEVPAVVPELTGPFFHFSHADRDELQLGYGVAGEWRSWGRERLSRLRTHARRLSHTWQHLDPDETGLRGFALLGFAARPSDSRFGQGTDLPNAILWLPEVGLRARKGQAALVLTTALPADQNRLFERWRALLRQLIPALSGPAPGPRGPADLKRCQETPNADGWRRLLDAALDLIASRELEKVVLARRLRIEGSRDFDLSRLVAALGFFFPSCQVLSIRRDRASFVAATPERLLYLRGNRVEVDALAGTTSRSPQTERDGALARALCCSPKNLHEHRLVVRAICDALGPCASDIDFAPIPEVMQLNNAQHLWTRISAKLDSGADVFSLAERLHPTPATNGQPRCKASRWLQASDPFERGWYTGAAGILEPDLTGELWVLLRCAEVMDRTADLYAGAGIVEGSNPSLEWRETEHKLAAMLTALQFA